MSPDTGAAGWDPTRAVQTVAVDAAGGRWFGSGYLVTADLVLTAQHVLHGAGSVMVRFVDAPGRVRETGAAAVFADARADVAVLRLRQSEPPTGSVVFGDPDGRMDCDAVGFPRFKLNNDHRAAGPDRTIGASPKAVRGRYRDSHHAAGVCHPASNRYAGTLELTVPAPGPDPDAGRSPWEGMSGAAVFAGGRLIAVVNEHHPREGRGRLTASRVTAWFELLDPDRLVTLRALIGLPDSADLVRGSGLDAPVRAYLEAVGKAAEQHPHPGIPGHTAPPLAKVYVRQRSIPVSPGGPDASCGDSPPAGDSGPGVPAGPEPAEAVFRKPDRVCVLIAGPGCGKSTLLRTRLGEAALEWLGGAGTVGSTGAAVPVWVSARSLVGEQTQVPDALAAATRGLSRYGRHPELATARFLERPCTGGYWQLLVDGLDELANAAERRAVLEKLGNAVVEDPPLYRCVVATRPLTGNELKVLDRVVGHPVPRYDLQRFTDGDLHTYTEKYFGIRWQQGEAVRRAQQFTGALRGASLAELARTPLMAFMLCQFYLAKPERPLPEGRTALYEAFTELIYENNHSKHVADSHEEAIRRLVEGFQSPRARREVDEAARQVHEQLPELIDHLAHQRHTGHQAEAAATHVAHKAAICRPGKVRPELWDAFLEDLLRHTGLVVHDADGLGFSHQTFREYHAARHATRDRHARRETLHQLFDPGEPSPGWQNQDPSYVGFLLDRLLTPHDDRISEETEARLQDPATTGGEQRLEFLDFLVQQVTLRTNLPVESTTRQLARYTTDSTVTPYRRNNAAEALVVVNVEQGAQVLETLATESAFPDQLRIRAASQLAEVNMERGAQLLESLAENTALPPDARVGAAGVLARTGMERGAQLLEAFAYDMTHLLRYQMQAAEALGRIDPGRGVRLLEALINDPTRDSETHAQAAKTRVAVERAVRVPETRANEPVLNDPTLTFAGRLSAGEALAAQGDVERGARILEALAVDPHLQIDARMEAAQALERVDPVRGAPLTTDIWLEAAGGYV
ncbi:trypsin-like peptidase domain-containing protein [Embleya hyalina]|uniref:Histidine kinase n=1 Tax=Embleya hyalina TaxID=516124 RepID=A0A401YXE8_9ACTN|nr:trypsin-like peptidase domain-containing protein [Embleya hyalina]GCD99269.1 histidine kinase [Embleya hyalina]